mmetsp:Transcript_74342/g.145219  ORF Transcript_74342/g.145219 Transcript_74342/m.145219 type:complete len:203 (+) Transcript_74342:216-824(+)
MSEFFESEVRIDRGETFSLDKQRGRTQYRLQADDDTIDQVPGNNSIWINPIRLVKLRVASSRMATYRCSTKILGLNHTKTVASDAGGSAENQYYSEVALPYAPDWASRDPAILKIKMDHGRHTNSLSLPMVYDLISCTSPAATRLETPHVEDTSFGVGLRRPHSGYLERHLTFSKNNMHRIRMTAEENKSWFDSALLDDSST